MWDSMVYVKYGESKSFGAFNLSKNQFVGRVYATLLLDSPEVRQSLQAWADKNREHNLVVQLRRGKKVIFQTN